MLAALGKRSSLTKEQPLLEITATRSSSSDFMTAAATIAGFHGDFLEQFKKRSAQLISNSRAGSPSASSRG
jgi:hypothetical protein